MKSPLHVDQLLLPTISIQTHFGEPITEAFLRRVENEYPQPRAKEERRQQPGSIADIYPYSARPPAFILRGLEP